MLERARPLSQFGGRRPALPNACNSRAFPTVFFDAAVLSFLFCVLPDPLQIPVLRTFTGGQTGRSGSSAGIRQTAGPAPGRPLLLATLGSDGPMEQALVRETERN